MVESPKVTILMATYNGASYLETQLDSIIRQSYKNWELIIRDDESSDGTPNVIDNYTFLDSRITVLKYGDLHGSACKNFSQLFDWAYENEKGYLMFADQDDIWLPEKIEVSLRKLKVYETIYQENTPLMCYGTLQFIDHNGNTLKSKLAMPSKLDLRVILNENYAWGCTIILNLAALKVIKHIPPASVNHDYYIALVLSAIGHGYLIDQDLIQYRQHEKNVSGSVNNMRLSNRFNRYFKNNTYMLKPLIENLLLVECFYIRYRAQLNVINQEMIHKFLDAYKKGFIPLTFVMLKYNIMKMGFGKNVVYFYTLWLLRKKVVESIQQKKGL